MDDWDEDEQREVADLRAWLARIAPPAGAEVRTREEDTFIRNRHGAVLGLLFEDGDLYELWRPDFPTRQFELERHRESAMFDSVVTAFLAGTDRIEHTRTLWGRVRRMWTIPRGDAKPIRVRQPSAWDPFPTPWDMPPRRG